MRQTVATGEDDLTGRAVAGAAAHRFRHAPEELAAHRGRTRDVKCVVNCAHSNGSRDAILFDECEVAVGDGAGG